MHIRDNVFSPSSILKLCCFSVFVRFVRLSFRTSSCWPCCTHTLQQSPCKWYCHRNVCLAPPASFALALSLFIIACAEILMRLCLHHLCLGYLAPTDQQAGCLLFAKLRSPFKKTKTNPTQTNVEGWGNTPCWKGRFHLAVIWAPVCCFPWELFHTTLLFVTFWKRHVLLLTSPPLRLCCLPWTHRHGCDLSPLCCSHLIPRWCYLS